MIVTRATLGDVDMIMRWRCERVAWLASTGEDQWSISLPRWAVAASVLAGQTWMVRMATNRREPSRSAGLARSTTCGSRTSIQKRCGIHPTRPRCPLRGEDHGPIPLRRRGFYPRPDRPHTRVGRLLSLTVPTVRRRSAEDKRVARTNWLGPVRLVHCSQLGNQSLQRTCFY